MKRINFERASGDDMGMDKYLIFKLGAGMYGASVTKIKKVELEVNIVPVVQAEENSCFVSGLSQVKGSMIPVFDLKKRLALGETELTPTTGTLIVDVNKDDGVYTNGVLVDEVCEIREIKKENIRSSYDVRSNTRRVRDFISGVGEVEGREISLLNLPRILELTPDLYTALEQN